ncbi:proteolipid protein 2 isoform X2 [Hyperolius riggenbachi]|uniref:proteolipid protein 2 isoform X2 n=1 Tax=Hyperolius riggenbachi TaxID=752182 RepID=UPI0035A34614
MTSYIHTGSSSLFFLGLRYLVLLSTWCFSYSLFVVVGACLVVLICYAASRTPGYLGVAITELIFSTIFFFLFALSIHQQIAFIHWGWTDFIRAAVGGGLFIILSIVCLIRGGDGAGIAGSVFGLLTGILFGYDAFITFPTLKKTHAPAATESPDNI